MNVPLGDLVYLRIFGRHVLVLHSLEAIADLLEKRSEMYSDRPQRAMATLYELSCTL